MSQQVFEMIIGEPPEYDYEEHYKKWVSKKESKEWIIPDDNILVEKEKNCSRYAESTIPFELLDKKSRSTKTYLKECAEYFSSDYIHCKRIQSRDIPIQDSDVQKKIE